MVTIFVLALTSRCHAVSCAPAVAGRPALNNQPVWRCVVDDDLESLHVTPSVARFSPGTVWNGLTLEVPSDLEVVQTLSLSRSFCGPALLAIPEIRIHLCRAPSSAIGQPVHASVDAPARWIEADGLSKRTKYWLRTAFVGAENRIFCLEELPSGNVARLTEVLFPGPASESNGLRRFGPKAR